MQQKDPKDILIRYKSGECTKEEKALVENWIMFYHAERVDLSDSEILADLTSISIGLPLALSNDKHVKIRPLRDYWRTGIAAAAVIIIMLGCGLYFYKNNSIQKLNDSTLSHQAVITPGGNRAYLTLANGKKITLEQANNGEVAKEIGVKITKTSDGQLIYEVQNQASFIGGENNEQYNSIKPQFNTIETPKGGQYQIRLPDGTKVWLNAASKLKYPASFAAMSQRKVELSGEAYFEVLKSEQDSKQGKRHVPFIVKTATQEIEVLGTHFNINSYNDQPYVKTTLLEGSVIITLKSKSVIIKPNQQALSTPGSQIQIKDVNVKDAIAWKNGLFSFKSADIEEIMRQVSRWYNVDVVYDTTIPSTTFTGKIYRNVNLTQVLESIAFLGLDFQVEGHTIRIKNKL